MEFTIDFLDGTKAQLDSNVTMLTLYRLQNEGAVDGKFLKGFMQKEADLDPISIAQAMYAAYRQATDKKKAKNFEEFMENYQMDLEIDMQIYFAIVTKRARDEFAKQFKKKTGSSKGKK
ncbi:hypothetical protein ARQ41_00025 [Listeria monocytogenes]|nr:hypothetical protein [Listeria monocytogenes]EAF4932639.1 hypothetical protein [Listeria monocytogenes]